MTFSTLMQLLGGVGMFLFAIKLISESLQNIAGARLRGIIEMFTRTPVLGVFLGTLATVLIQSSSAVTVMTVSFVDAGLMNLSQAIGVIMGANVGTTVTGQILAFNMKEFAYLFIIGGVLIHFSCKRNHWKQIGIGLFGFGLLFVGMQTMETSMSFLRDRKELFLAFSENPLMGLGAGALLTLLIQSSAATVGLTMALGMQGLLPLDAAIPIIFGDNVGTTLTSVLASFGTGRSARQACAAHVLFNVIGVCVWLPFMPLWIGVVEATSSSVAHQIANAHSLFNICNTLLFLPFVKYFAALIRKIIPDDENAALKDVQYLDPLLLDRTPVVAVSAVRYECRHMGEVVSELLERSACFPVLALPVPQPFVGIPVHALWACAVSVEPAPHLLRLGVEPAGGRHVLCPVADAKTAPAAHAEGIQEQRAHGASACRADEPWTPASKPAGLPCQLGGGVVDRVPGRAEVDGDAFG